MDTQRSTVSNGSHPYPERVIEDALDRARREDLQRRRQGQTRGDGDDDDDDDDSNGRSAAADVTRGDCGRNFAWKTLSCWRHLHFCVLAPDVGHFDATEWILGSNMVYVGSSTTEEAVLASVESGEDLDGYVDDAQSKVVDVDLEDSSGKLYKTRVLYNRGCDCGGYFGKVFDRSDCTRTRVLAEIKNYGEFRSIIRQTDHAAGFVEHDDLKGLHSYLLSHTYDWSGGYETQWSGGYETQFEMIVRFILFVASEEHRNHYEISNEITKPKLMNGEELQREKLNLLAKSGYGTVNEGNLAFEVLCGGGGRAEDAGGRPSSLSLGHHHGHIIETIAQYASEKYAVPERELDNSFDWFIEPSLMLALAIRVHAEGNSRGTEWAMKVWYKRLPDELAWIVPEINYVLGLGDLDDLDDLLNDLLDEIRPLTLGLEDDYVLFDSLTERLWSKKMVLRAECCKKTTPASRTKICQLIEEDPNYARYDEDIDGYNRGRRRCRNNDWNEKYTPLLMAIDGNQPTEILQRLIDAWPESVSFECYCGTPLHHACSTGASLEVIQFLVKACPDSVKKWFEDYSYESLDPWEDEDDMIPLKFACRHFVSSDAACDAQGKAVSKEVARYLLEVWPYSERYLTEEQKQMISG